MSNVFFSDYRPRWLYQNSPSLAITEGDAATVYNDVIDVASVPIGWYKVHLAVDWKQTDVGKYFEFGFTINGTSRVFRKETTFNSGIVNDFATTFFFPIAATSGLNVDLQVEFPAQAGSASGTFEAVQITFEKWGEFPTP